VVPAVALPVVVPAVALPVVVPAVALPVVVPAVALPVVVPAVALQVEAKAALPSERVHLGDYNIIHIPRHIKTVAMVISNPRACC